MHLPNTWVATNPYGVSVHSDDIESTLTFLSDWEERYGYILDLARDLPDMPAEFRTTERLIRGCQSQVWIEHECHDGRLRFMVDSDAQIVRGLIAIVLAAFNDRDPQNIVDFAIDDYFGRIDLLRHLSPTRGNGLRAMVARVREIALAASRDPH